MEDKNSQSDTVTCYIDW